MRVGVQQFGSWRMVVLWTLTAIALGRLLPLLAPGGMPQHAGNGLMGQLLGGTRLVFSEMMVKKADEYFHGGVRCMDCEHGLTSGRLHDRKEHVHHGGAGPSPECATPWQRINQQVHVQEHRHLHGAEASEVLPWLWAAGNLSADNTEAFGAATYVLTRFMGNPGAAKQLLTSGITRSPDNAELHFLLGELYLNYFHDMPGAERAFASALRIAKTKKSGGVEADKLLRLRTLFYLGYLAVGQGAMPVAQGYLREAEALSPTHACTRDLRRVVEGGAGRN